MLDKSGPGLKLTKFTRSPYIYFSVFSFQPCIPQLNLNFVQCDFIESDPV